jgi:hypothetical protein
MVHEDTVQEVTVLVLEVTVLEDRLGTMALV